MLKRYFLFIQGDNKFICYYHTYEKAKQMRDWLKKETGLRIIICRLKGQQDENFLTRPYKPTERN